jgi:prepilin-type processing-associated H-X9-DG protein
VRQSAIARYVPGFDAGALLVCPSDDPGFRARDLGSSEVEGVYRYSYAMNLYVGGVYAGPSCETKLTRVRNSSEKVMLVEEDAGTIDDGSWLPDLVGFANLLAVRHDRTGRVGPAPADAGLTAGLPFSKMRGNVAFLDGHVDFVPRRDAHDPRHFLPRR